MEDLGIELVLILVFSIILHLISTRYRGSS